MTSKKEKIIAIGGGVGPMAGVELHKKIIEHTKTDGTDQDHFEVHHLSRSHDIPDRTDYLLDKAERNPAEGMLNTAKAAEEAAKIASKEAVFGVPCNTFHAPKIFNKFLELLKEQGIKMQVVNMIEEVGDYLKETLPNVKKIGLMSTTGTRSVRVYRELLEPMGFEILEVPNEDQEELHNTIYNKEWGIKAKTPVDDKARANFLNYVKILKDQGADAVILGCTEIPLALPEEEIDGVKLIDPVVILAKALIREANINKLKEIKKE